MIARFRRWLRRSPPILTSQRAYALWAEDYPPFPHNRLMQREQEIMLELLPDLFEKGVIDLASGTGRYARLAVEQGAQHVIAVDNSMAMLERNAHAYRVLAPMNALPLPNASADVVVCALAIGHVPTIAPVFGEIARVLIANGTALVSDVHPILFNGEARRTFQAKGTTYAVEHTAHSIALVTKTAQAAGLNLRDLREAGLSDTMDSPVVVVYRFERA
jgi:malonyl-CoA O-methyltransferase